MNRQPKGKPHKIIRNNSQDDKVKASIGTYFEKNVIKHFLPGMEDEVIFHLRGVIKDDRNISDAKRAELQLLGKKETFAEFLGQVYLYSLTRDNVLSPEAKQMLERELEDYKKNPLQTIDIPESIINEERAYTAALMAAYTQELGDSSLTIDTLAEHAVQAKHLPGAFSWLSLVISCGVNHFTCPFVSVTSEQRVFTNDLSVFSAA